MQGIFTDRYKFSVYLVSVPRFRRRNGSGKNPSGQGVQGGDFFALFAKNTTRPLTVWDCLRQGDVLCSVQVSKLTDKYKLNKIAARWPAKAVAQFSLSLELTR